MKLSKSATRLLQYLVELVFIPSVFPLYTTTDPFPGEKNSKWKEFSSDVSLRYISVTCKERMTHLIHLQKNAKKLA